MPAWHARSKQKGARTGVVSTCARRLSIRLSAPVLDAACRRQCLETITENILAKGGEITVNMAPKAVSAREDSELAAQMERLAMEGEQVDGDDDDDEGSDDE